MELQEAFETVFNELVMKEAISSIESNREEAGDILLEKLKERVKFLEEAPEGEGKPDDTLNKILWLLGRLKIKNAFPCLWKLLRINQCCRALAPQTLLNCLSNLISDENAPLLRTGVLEGTICQDARKAVCFAVSEFYRKAEKPQETERFFSDLVSSFEKANLENFEDYDLLFGIISLSMDLRSASLREKLKNLLIQLIICSKSGFHASWFKDYFCFLYRLDPLIAAKIHDAEKYLRSLCCCKDREIFQFEEMEDIGKYLCAKAFGTVKGIDLNIVKIAIKKLNYYPFNERPCPTNDKQYYQEICAYLGLKKIPKYIYQQAKDLYQETFISGYATLKGKIEALVQKTEAEKQKITKDIEKIIADANGDRSLFKTMDDDMHRLAQNEIWIKELNSLYKKGEQGSTGMLVYTLRQVECFLKLFCEEIDDQEKVDEKLREISIQCAVSDTMKIGNYFRKYQRALGQINTLLSEEPVTTLQNIFYHVKFVPFAEMIQEKYKFMEAKGKECGSIICERRREEENHPLCPTNLMNSAKKSLTDYAGVLEQHLDQLLGSIRAVLNRSVCLKKRRAVLEHCLDIIERGEDELAINLLPVQMEGLFADLLEYTTIYRYIENIKLYNSLFNLEMAEKIERSENCDINIAFDIAAYFKYYFSSVIRNTVAHGNYFLLAGIHGEHWNENEDEGAIRRVLALELLLDLNCLVGAISEINEIDTAKRYIEDTADQCAQIKETEREIVYISLFQDLNGTKERFNISKYKSGIFVTYDAQQILFWIFNPHYEQYLDADSLSVVRGTVCSAGFWKYIQEHLKELREGIWRKGKLSNIVHKMLKEKEYLMQKRLMEPDTIDLMKKVSALLKET